MHRTQRSVEEEEELEFSKQQLRIREMDRKSTFEHTQTEVRRQKDSLQLLRRENKELRSVLSQTAKGHSANSDNFHSKQSGLVATRVHQARRQLDDLRSANDSKVVQIQKMSESIEVLTKEAQPLLQDDSPMAQKIRMLENRLDKSLIKHNEAMAIRRTYETIVKRLRDERVGFDNQLSAIEKTLRAKEHDFTELRNMEHDAHHAKEIAKAEVQQFKSSYADERRLKKKELEDRKAYVQARMDQAVRQEKAMKQKQQKEDHQAVQKHEEEERRKKDTLQSTAELRTEEEEERLRQYAEAYRRIKEVTRAADVEEVIAKFIAQEETHRQLVEMTRDVQSKIDKQQMHKVDLRRKVEDSKYSGSGQLGSRRIIDEFETHLSEATLQLEKATKYYEKTSHTFTGVKAGVEHLGEKLSGYRPEMACPAMSDEQLVEAYKHCEQKLQMLVDEAIAGDEAIEDTMNTMEVDMPAHNVRVKILAEADEEDEEVRGRGDAKDAGEDADDDPHDRVALKEMSMSAVERETKKARKRRGKKDDEM